LVEHPIFDGLESSIFVEWTWFLGQTTCVATKETSLFDCWKSLFLMGSNSIDVTSGQSYHCFFSYKSPPWQASTKARGAIASISSWREALMEARSCRPGPSWRSWISWAYVWITTYQTYKSWIFVWIFDVI
jgi:hypothetical protein